LYSLKVVGCDSESVLLVVNLEGFLVEFGIGTESHYNSGRLGLLFEICELRKRKEVFKNQVADFGREAS
jgi:hypothetical protein